MRSSSLLFLSLVVWTYTWKDEGKQLVPYRLLRYEDKLVISKCDRGRVCKRIEGFATVPWGSPLDGHEMKVICPMQDDHLQSKDLSALHVPEWMTSHEDPVGRCPIRLQRVEDRNRVWPPELIAVKCACERSRCTMRSSHVCYTVYVQRSVIRRDEGLTKELISADCICAAQRARLIKLSLPKMVS